jgi:UPF0755 protein
MMRTIKNFVFWTLFGAIILVAAGGYYFLKPMPLSHTPLEFSLKPGSSLKSAASQMKEAGVLENEFAFVMFARALGKAAQIKYGNYQLEKATSQFDLLDIISSGRTEQSQITIIEGDTFNQLRAQINAHPGLRHDSALLSESEVLRRIGATEQVAEGLFFPDTYNFASGSSDLAVLKRAYQTMQRHLQETWQTRDTDLPFESPYQALILASIVEKETGQPSDRPMIASVFINRLQRNMRLQTDPAVIYGIGDKFDGNLRKKDLLQDTPYNTYTRAGLTPTPIALPGLASLQAVLHPASSKALYFVARGDGSSQFSESLVEHNNAVNRYQLKK